MKFIYLILGCILISLSLASAAPKVIFTDLNITINSTDTGGKFHLWGEGVNAKSDFSVSGNCTFSYSRINIPVTFSRDWEENDTDVAVLLRALAINNNATIWWHTCQTNLTECMHDLAYESNYTDCSGNLNTCADSRDNKNEELTKKNEEIATLKTHRILFGGLAIVLGMVAWSFRKKAVVQTVRSPASRLPNMQRI